MNVHRLGFAGVVTAVAALTLCVLQPAYADNQPDIQAQVQSLTDRISVLENERKAALALQLLKSEPAAAARPTPAPVNIAYPPLMQLITGDTKLAVYAILDATFATQTRANATGSQGTAPVVSWMSGNRFGIDSSHLLDKDSNLRIIGRLENEFELPTGNLDTPNVLFNRDAWVGLQNSRLGKITIGRQNTLPRDFAQIWGESFGSKEVTLDEGGWNNNAQMQYLINYAGGATGVRYNSAIVWKKQAGRFVVGLAHQFNGAGGYVPGDFSTGTTSAAAIAYNGGRINLSGTLSSADIGGYYHQVFGFGGNATLGPAVVVRAGYFHNSADQSVVGRRRDDVLTASVMITPPSLPKTQFDLGYNNITVQNAGFSKDGSTTLGVNSDTSTVTLAGSGGFRTIYAAAFYRWDRQADIYIAGDLVRTNGGFKYGFTHGFSSAQEYGTGLRYKI